MKNLVKTLSRVRQKEIIRLLTESGAVQKGHFVLSSGRHSDTFIGITEINSRPRFLDSLVNRLFEEFLRKEKIDIVVSPAMSGVLFGAFLAVKLKSEFAYSEFVNGKIVIRRGFELKINKSKRVLIADDTTTTGKIIKKNSKIIEGLGGVVVGYTTIWQRQSIPGLKAPIYSLVNKEIESWLKEECLLCTKGQNITITSNKRGEEFLNKYGKDPTSWPAKR